MKAKKNAKLRSTAQTYQSLLEGKEKVPNALEEAVTSYHPLMDSFLEKENKLDGVLFRKSREEAFLGLFLEP